MIAANGSMPHYEFAEKYGQTHALKYFNKHNSGLGRRLFTWREVGMARKALVVAGRPRSVLDLPCGTGRFWPMLAEEKSRKIYIADNSRAMMDTGLALRPREIVSRIENRFSVQPSTPHYPKTSSSVFFACVYFTIFQEVQIESGCFGSLRE